MANMTHRVIKYALLSKETTLLMNNKNKSERPLSERELRNARYFNEKQKAEAQKSAVLAEFSAVLAKISTSTAEIEECA